MTAPRQLVSQNYHLPLDSNPHSRNANLLWTAREHHENVFVSAPAPVHHPPKSLSASYAQQPAVRHPHHYKQKAKISGNSRVRIPISVGAGAAWCRVGTLASPSRLVAFPYHMPPETLLPQSVGAGAAWCRVGTLASPSVLVISHHGLSPL